MSCYITDISFNFYDELNNNDDDENNENNENICLISNLPLDETSITLPCQHKFNYYYIFNEVLNSKKKNYNFSSYLSKLEKNQIKCPYCRTIYNNLLPLPFDINGAYKVDSVNSPSYISFKIKCKEPNCKCNEPEETLDTNVTQTSINYINKIYVTPLGYYCKKHYTHIKNKNKKNGINVENKKNNSENNEQINENWISSNWNGYTVDHLKNILKQYKLKVSGKKALLITRLINNNILPYYPEEN